MARINDEKEHYKSLINLFKFALTVFSIFGVIIGYITYSDGKEMRQELKERRTNLEENFKEMRSDLEKQRKEHKDELVAQRSEMEKDRETLTKKFEEEINWTKSNAIYEISNIKSSSKEIAQSEARKKINDVFDNKNFDDFVAKIAKERMEPQINNLVDKKIELNETAQINSALVNLSSSDKVKSINASNYLQSNSHIKLSDSQISKIILDMDKVDVSTRNNMIFTIILRKSQPSTEFFTAELGNCATNTLNETYCLQYFLYNEIDFNIFSDATYKAMSKKIDGYNTYYSSILLSKDQNKRFALNLLNDRKLVNLYLKLLPESYREVLTSSFLVDLSQVFNQKDILQTVLFKTLKDNSKPLK